MKHIVESRTNHDYVMQHKIKRQKKQNGSTNQQCQEPEGPNRICKPAEQ